ncbi:hypothetical protein [Clostridium saccharobutylicum]|uniref:Uncharacterized protein n=1 Tax=Clostridium saccharobutylicum TaxID=169679 RepID=A0A1S8MNB7_CLOSA|nr:hypothetical protein [Clostridium saccharobutylicum]OOM05686.1 hypothetical protein CLOSAC_45550 [Clostridium saccharobutylicum]
MNLIFKEDKQISGKLCKAYLENWDFSRNNGSYAKGEDFLSIHWEIAESSPDEVRFHVEAPTHSIDNELNLIKSKIIILLLSKLIEIKNRINIGELKSGSRLTKIDINKSTEVFKIILDQKNIMSTAKENIDQVNSKVEDIINNVIEKFSLDIKNNGMGSTL